MTYLRTHGATSIAPPAPTAAASSTPARCIPRYARWAGQLPHLRNDAGAGQGDGGGGENHELTDMTRRFWVGLVLTLPVFVLEMGGHIPALGMHDLVPPQVSTWIQFALSTPVVLWAGWPFFQRAWASVVHRSLNMFSLIALGNGRGLPLQPVCDLRARSVSGRLSRHGRHGRRLFRGRGGDHRSRVAGPGAGIARPRADRRRDPRLAETGAQDGAPAESRRPGRGSRPRAGSGRRPS